MWRFTLKQGLTYFTQDKRKFFWISLQIFFAMTICYLIITLHYSASVTEQQLMQGSLEKNIKVMPLIRPDAQPRFVYTDQDLENLANIVGSDLEMIFYTSTRSAWSSDSGATSPLVIYFTNCIAADHYFLTEEAYNTLFGLNSQFIFSTYGGAGIIDDVKAYVERPSTSELNNLSPEVMVKHGVTSLESKLTSEVMEQLPEALVFMPIDYFLHEHQGDKVVNAELIFFYEDKVDPLIITEVGTYLDDKYGNEFRFLYFSDVEFLSKNISELRFFLRIAVFLLATIIVMIILSMSGLVNGLIQQRLSEFSIKRCLGVTKQKIMFEVITCVTIPGVIGGCIALLIGSRLLQNISVPHFQIQQSFLGVMLSFIIVLLIPLLSCLIPYFNYRHVEPLEILKVKS